MTAQPMNPITVTAHVRTLPDGGGISVAPLAEGVHVDRWNASLETVFDEAISYDDYARLREAHPELQLPELAPSDTPSETSADAGAGAPTDGASGTGNTIGRIVGEAPAAAVPAEQANPPVDERNALEKTKDGLKGSIDDWVESTGYNQGAMVAGAIGTAVVEVFMPEALWELIPVGKVVKIADKGVEAVQNIRRSRRADTPGSGGRGGQVRGRARQRVKCFCPQDRARGGRNEYDRQLKSQQDGINAMSVDDYLARRGGFTGINPCTGQSVPKAPGRDPSVTRDATNRWQKDQTERYSEQFRDQGLGRNDARSMGATAARRDRGQQNALHNPDMVAGGLDAIGLGGNLSSADFGFGDTNQHIGSQWRGDRISSMDAEACRRQQAGQGNEKMNVELRACGRREARAAGCKPSPRR